MKAKAILFTGIDKVEIGSVLIPDPGPGEVLIKAVSSCISAGTPSPSFPATRSPAA